MADPELRTAVTTRELRAAAERLCLPAVAVAPALVVVVCGALTFAGSFAAARQSGKVRIRSEAAVLP